MTPERATWLAFALALAACGNAHTPGEEAERDEEVEAEGGIELTLSPEAIARSRIVTGTASMDAIWGGRGVPAELEPDPAFTAHVSSLVACRLVRIEVAVGDEVSAGRVLAVVASGDVGESRAALASARARRDAALAARDRQAALVESGIGARRALIEAEAELADAEADVRGLSTSLRVVGRGGGSDVAIIAPIAGVISERHATVGEVAAAGEPLFTITDPSHLWVIGHVPELDLSLAQAGAAAVLSVPAFPGERWPAHIDVVAPALDEATRTLRVRAALEAPDPRLRAGLFGRLTITLDGAGSTALVVPATALARLGGEDVVFVPTEEPGGFRAVPVRVGRREGAIVEILDGLEEGDAVVIEGTFTLRSELSRGEIAEDED